MLRLDVSVDTDAIYLLFGRAAATCSWWLYEICAFYTGSWIRSYGLRQPIPALEVEHGFSRTSSTDTGSISAPSAWGVLDPISDCTSTVYRIAVHASSIGVPSPRDPYGLANSPLTSRCPPSSCWPRRRHRPFTAPPSIAALLPVALVCKPPRAITRHTNRSDVCCRGGPGGQTTCHQAPVSHAMQAHGGRGSVDAFGRHCAWLRCGLPCCVPQWAA